MEIVIDLKKKKDWTGCPACKKKRKRHFAKGVCQACYSKAYRQATKQAENGGK